MAITDATRLLDELQDHPRNYNRHNEATVRLLADTIRAVGFTKPLVITPRNVILAGHRAKRALLLLREEHHAEPLGIGPGWRVPVRVADVPELVEQKILVSDNPDPTRIEFDTAGLTELLAELANSSELTGSGYDQERLDALIEELAAQPASGLPGTGPGVDPNAEWDGMPEFVHDDLTAEGAFTLKVFFANAEELERFGEMIGKDCTGRKFVWFGKQPQGTTFEAVDGEEE